MNLKLLTPERKLKYLSQYMELFVDQWPGKPKPFESWLQSTMDKKMNKANHQSREKARRVCYYCRQRFDEDYGIDKTKDHVIPLSKGGLDKKENRVPCCFGCNQWKQDLFLNDWLRGIRRLVKKEKPYPSYTLPMMGIMIGNIQRLMDETKRNNSKVSTYKVPW